jgi:hypothetical protein
MLRQMKNFGIMLERFKILLRLTILNLAHCALRETKPPSKQLLTQRLAEKTQMTRMIPVSPENLTDMPTRERRPELVRLKKLVPKLRRRTELITLVPVTPTAQRCSVVSRKHRPATRTAPTTNRTTRPTSLPTGNTHLITPSSSRSCL